MNVGFLITARLKSTRLPKKVCLPLSKAPLIVHMINRIKLCTSIRKIVVCTSINPQDDALEKIAKNEGVSCYRGSEEDVLERLCKATTHFGFDYVLNVTADCPLVSYDYFDYVLDYYKKNPVDLITTFTLPHGFYFYGIKPEALIDIVDKKTDHDTEVWGPIVSQLQHLKTVDMCFEKYVELFKETIHRPTIRLTIDYPEDYKLLQHIFDQFDNAYAMPTEKIIQYLDLNKALLTINASCEEKYKKNLKQ